MSYRLPTQEEINRMKQRRAEELQDRMQEELKQKENDMRNSVENIDKMCSTVTDDYNSMRRNYKEYYIAEKELDQTRKNYTDFLGAYQDPSEDESRIDPLKKSPHQQSILRFAYYALPMADCILALPAITPIMMGKLSVGIENEDVVQIVGLVVALIFGVVLSWISRVAMASSNNQSAKRLRY